MTRNYERAHAMNFFACGQQGNALTSRIHAMARHEVGRHVKKLDPNWCRVDIVFDRSGEEMNLALWDRPMSDANACEVTFNYRPTEVRLVGPKVGNVFLTDKVFEMIPEPLIALMCMFDVVGKPWFHRLANPQHRVELLDGRTLVNFEHCHIGVVRNVNGDDFDIEMIGDVFRLDTPPGECMTHYTRKQLLDEMAMDVQHGQAVSVDYLPIHGTDGKVLDTVESLREAEAAAPNE